MRIEFKDSFVRDLKRIRDNSVRDLLRVVVDSAEQAQSLQEISDVKKLKHGDRYFRIRVKEYRIGLKLDGDTLIFVRILHRKDLYRYFP